MAFQSSIIAIGAVVLQSALNSLGTDVVAARCRGKDRPLATQPMMSSVVRSLYLLNSLPI